MNNRATLERTIQLIRQYKLTAEPVHTTYQGVLTLSSQQHNAWNILTALEKRT